jgi:hypothetical protein
MALPRPVEHPVINHVRVAMLFTPFENMTAIYAMPPIPDELY